MTVLAPTLQAFFTDRLRQQRHASDDTIRAYRDTWRLLLGYAATKVGSPPSQLDLADLDAPLIADFLDHLAHYARQAADRCASLHDKTITAHGGSLAGQGLRATRRPGPGNVIMPYSLRPLPWQATWAPGPRCIISGSA